MFNKYLYFTTKLFKFVKHFNIMDDKDVREHRKKDQEVAKIDEKDKKEMRPSKKEIEVGIFLMRKSGDLEFFTHEAYSLVQIDNSIYEWDGRDDYAFSYRTKQGKLSCNSYYEGNPKAQQVKRGINLEAYEKEGKFLSGKDMMNKMQLAVMWMGMLEKATKGHVVTEGNIKWLWIVIGIIVVAAIVIGVGGLP